ncbi:MAG: SMC family ATPase [Anaerolineaceae bacterium]|nr:SMC family ATPase [Anaerolineaceae bacterium]
MIPVYLRISGFLSYIEPAELDFSSFDLACISGANGAGKSSLLDAMTWALFGQARRRDDALINSHAQAAEVIFDFAYEDNLYRVQRSKPAGKTGILEFFIHDGEDHWRPLTEHSLRETESRIQQTLRLDYETFTNASFFLQGKADQFAQQRPGDRKRILSSVLGLEVWENYRNEAAERRKRQESELAGLNDRLGEIESELAEEDTRRERLQAMEKDLKQVSRLREESEATLEGMRRLAASLDEQRRLVDVLAGQLHSAQARQEQLNERITARREERQQYQAQLDAAAAVEAAYTRWQQLRGELEAWEASAAHFHQHEARRAEPLLAIESERLSLEHERQSLAEQAARAGELQAALPTTEHELEAAHALLAETQADLEQRPQIEAEIRTLQDTQVGMQAENRRLKAEMDELRERIQRLKETSGAECPLCGQPLGSQERLDLITRLEAEGKEKGDRYRQNLEDTRQAKEQRAALEKSLERFGLVESQLRQRQRQVDQLENQAGLMRQALESWQAQGVDQLEALQRRLKTEDYAHEWRARLAETDAALKQLGYDAAAHDAARRAEQEARQSEAQYRQLEAARAALGPLEREIAGLEQEAAQRAAEMKTLEDAYHTAEEKYRAEAAGQPDLNQAEARLFDLREQENRLRMQVGGAIQAVEVLQSLRVRQKELGAKREVVNRQIARLKMVEKACGKDGVPALLIEQALPEIEAQANDILDRLTAGGMSVRFATQKDYKDRHRDDKKETLDILISDSAGVREYELFSGGEAFRVNFAIRLALSRVLAQRAGARLQTLVIDEGFGSQDTEGRQRLIEAINLVRPDFAKVLVITHLEELKEAFPARIEVEKTLHGSHMKVVV